MRFFLFVYLFCISVYSKEIIFSSGEWAPYTSSDLSDQGFASEVVKIVMEEMGQKYKTEFFPWTRAMELVKSNNVAGSFPWSITEARKKDLFFTDPFIENDTVLFYLKKKKKIDYESLADLKEYKIGATRSYFHGEALRQAGLTLDIGRNDKIGFKKLMQERIDLFPCNKYVGLDLIQKEFPGKESMFTYIEKPISSVELGLAVSKTYPGAKEFIEQFNKNLSIIRKKGIIDNLIKKYKLN